jgi:hypothetical protein
MLPFVLGTLGMLALLVFLLVYGYLTRPDPTHTGRDNSLHRRHMLFVVWFVVFKFAYALLISLTVFTLILRAIHIGIREKVKTGYLP